MGRLGTFCVLGLVLGLSGCAGAGHRLAAKTSAPERGGAAGPSGPRWRREPQAQAPAPLAARERTGSAPAPAPTAPGQPGGLNRYFPSLGQRGTDAPAPARGAGADGSRANRADPTGPGSPLPPPSDYRGPATPSDEAALRRDDPPTNLPVALDVVVHPDLDVQGPARAAATVAPDRRPGDRAALRGPASRPGPRSPRSEPGVIPTSAEREAPEVAAPETPAAENPPIRKPAIAVPSPSTNSDSPAPPTAPVDPREERTTTGRPALAYPVGEEAPPEDNRATTSPTATQPPMPDPRVATKPTSTPAQTPISTPTPISVPTPTTISVPAPTLAPIATAPPMPRKQLPGPDSVLASVAVAPTGLPTGLGVARVAPVPTPVKEVPHRPVAPCKVVTKYWGLGLFGLVRSHELLHGPDCPHGRRQPQSQPSPPQPRPEPPKAQPPQVAGRAPFSLFPPAYFACAERKPEVTPSAVVTEAPETVPAQARGGAVAAGPASGGGPATPTGTGLSYEDRLRSRLAPSPAAPATALASAPAPRAPRAAPTALVPPRVSLFARLWSRVRPPAGRGPRPRADRDTVPASLRGEPRDVAQRGQSVERVAADRPGEPPQR